MKRDDDQQLWDLLGRTPGPRLSAFFSRNVLRQIRQEPRLRLFGRGGTWLNLRILVPASGVALAVILGAVFLRSSAPKLSAPSQAAETIVAAEPAKVPEAIAKADVPVTETAVEEKSDSLPDESGGLAGIEEQDYDVVANLDDLLVLYETSLWDQNSSL